MQIVLYFSTNFKSHDALYFRTEGVHVIAMELHHNSYHECSIDMVERMSKLSNSQCNSKAANWPPCGPHSPPCLQPMGENNRGAKKKQVQMFTKKIYTTRQKTYSATCTESCKYDNHAWKSTRLHLCSQWTIT